MKRKKVLLQTASILLVFMFIMIAGCAKLEKKDTADETMAEWAQYTAQVDKTKKKIGAAEEQLLTLVTKWNEMLEEKGKSAEAISLEEQQEMDSFERLSFWTYMRMKNEQEVGILPMINEIYDLNKQIVDLQTSIEDISTFFKAPYEVHSGDTHFQLALKYLDSRDDVPEDRKIGILRKAGLWDELQVGFLVYFYYDGEKLQTSVHQGKASISPTAHRRKLDEARRLEFEARADSMLAIIKEKEELSDSLSMRIVELDVEIQAKIGTIDSLSQLNIDLRKENVVTKKKMDTINLTSNSIFFSIVSEKELRDRGLFGGGFLFFRKPSLEASQAFSQLDFGASIDIRETSVIEINATPNKGKIEIFSEQGAKLDEEDYSYDWTRSRLSIRFKRLEPFTGHKVLIMNR